MSRDPNRSGRFITFEGGEGTGKSTQLRLAQQALAAAGRDVVTTREPGGTANAERLRDLLLAAQTAWSPLAETILHFAARAENIARVVGPALAAGRWVLSDRYFDSTMAYQGWGLGVDRGAIALLRRIVDTAPDLTIILDAPPEELQARLRGRGRAADRYERLGPAFHARVAEGYRAIAAAEPARCVLIPAGGPVDEVHQAVMAAIASRLA